MKFTIKKSIGIVLIVIGVIGLFVPILQGLLLVAAGLYLLEYEPINRFVKKLKERWKKKKS